MSMLGRWFGRMGRFLARIGLPRELREAVATQLLPQLAGAEGKGRHG
ncbi:MAG: hypothetical protein AB7I59_02050 [Geminicoccaceae bacterium]